MKCMCRIVVAPRGRQRCGLQRSSHSCSPSVRVLDGTAPGTVVPATPEFGMEGVEDVGVLRADSAAPEERRDVVADAAAVQPEGARRTVELLEVALDQLVDGCVRPRVPPLRHLAQQPVTSGLCLTVRARPGPAESSPQGSGDASSPGRHRHRPSRAGHRSTPSRCCPEQEPNRPLDAATTSGS